MVVLGGVVVSVLANELRVLPRAMVFKGDKNLQHALLRRGSERQYKTIKYLL
jgi:hypothetical protein